MDLERIKQNLRLRSGRTRKPKKKQAPIQVSQQPKTGLPNGVATSDPSPPKSTQPKEAEDQGENQDQKEIPRGLPNLEAEDISTNRPEPPHAATGSNRDSPEQGPPNRYGHSSIEKPKRRPSHAPPAPPRTMAEPYTSNSDTDEADYDLRPPAARPQPPSLEATSELLFSPGHLNSLLQEPQSVAKFTAFLSKYKPEFQPLILRYLGTQKAIKAVQYANAIAEGAASEEGAASNAPSAAATLNKAFEEASTSSFKSLVGTALPMYITYCLVKIVTECLINEITGRQTPSMRNLVGGLSEVFCITDPKQEDNPIIYASEEFYRLTGYSTDDVIGHNCRFLQGAKTNRDSPRRLRENIEKGEEHCETLLNYRRDGRPFINLLMIAPLHDNKGKVKYHIGAQADVTGLVEGGRCLDDFERYLQLKQNDRGRRKDPGPYESKQRNKALQKLQELSEMFDLEESAVVQSHSRASSLNRDDDIRSVGSSERRQRRVFVDPDQSDEDDDGGQKQSDETWNLGQSGPLGLSGKLPGIYDSYMLIRAGPSLRIIFVSPKLRKIGNVVQRPFLAHVAAPASTVAGLKESFSSGVPVSAKINFMPKAGEQRDGTKTLPGTKLEDGKYGKTCWISATPMLGSDDRVGVWMIVIVEKSKVRRSTGTAEVEAKISAKARNNNRPTRIDMPTQDSTQHQTPEAPQLPPEELPIKPRRLEDSGEDLTNHNPELSAGLDLENDTHDETQLDGVAEFVSPKALPKTPERNGRILIKPDSEDDRDSPEWQLARDQFNAASTNPTSELDRKYTPPPLIPDSMQNATPPPWTPSVQVQDSTPTRSRFDQDREENGENEDSDSPSDRLRPSMGPGGMLSMDYLRHPGSRNATDRKGGDNDKWTDTDCMRSPYSVD